MTLHCTTPTRIDLLFTMSDNPQHAARRATCAKRCFADDSFKQPRSSSLVQAGSAIKPSGGARRDRTDDLMLAKHALSQLSYGPITRRRMLHASLCSERGYATRSRRRSVVGLGRLELPTSRLSSARSNQLSYKPVTLFRTKDLRSSRALAGLTAGNDRTTARAFRACVFVREERETKTAKSRLRSSSRSGDQ